MNFRCRKIFYQSGFIDKIPRKQVVVNGNEDKGKHIITTQATASRYFKKKNNFRPPHLCLSKV